MFRIGILSFMVSAVALAVPAKADPWLLEMATGIVVPFSTVDDSRQVRYSELEGDMLPPVSGLEVTRSVNYYGETVTGSAKARANLPAGEFGVYGYGNRVPNNHPGAQPNSYIQSAGIANLQYNDSLVFSYEEGSSPVVTLEIDLDGDIIRPTGTQGIVRLGFGMSGMPSGNSLYYQRNEMESETQEFFQGNNWVRSGDTFSLTFTPLADVINFGFNLYAAGYGALSDFYGTAAFSVLAPDGVTVTSGSGLFLQQVVGVPEPSSLVIVVGLAALIGLRLARQRAATRS